MVIVIVLHVRVDHGEVLVALAVSTARRAVRCGIFVVENGMRFVTVRKVTVRVHVLVVERQERY